MKKQIKYWAVVYPELERTSSQNPPYITWSRTTARNIQKNTLPKGRVTQVIIKEITKGK